MGCQHDNRKVVCYGLCQQIEPTNTHDVEENHIIGLGLQLFGRFLIGGDLFKFTFRGGYQNFFL
jgi:hypothetical protein